MTELLLHRSPSAARTSQLVLTDSQHKSKWEVAVHPNVPNDEYRLREIFEVNPTESDIRKLIGDKVLVFRGDRTRALIYFYGQPEPFKVAESSVGVPTALFRELAAQAQAACRANAPVSLNLRIHTSLLRLGSFNSRPVQNRPMFAGDLGNYRTPMTSGSPLSQSPTSGGSVLGGARVQSQSQTQTRTATHQSSSIQPRLPRAPAYRTYGHYVYDERDDVGDVLFMSMFPGIAPLYRPNSMLAWTLWFNSVNYMPGPYFYDPFVVDDWAFVPGFPGAVSQVIVPFGDGYRVEIMDAEGLCLANFSLSGYGQQMEIVTGDGDIFSVFNTGQPYIQYVDGDQAFCWNGVDTPLTGSPLEVDAAIAAAGPLYEPGPMVFADPIGYDAGVVYEDAQPFYTDPGDVVDSGAVAYDNAPEPLYDNGGFQVDPYASPSYIEPNVYAEPRPLEERQEYVDNDSDDQNASADSYSGGGDDYATVDDSSGGSSDWSDGGGGGDDWS